MKKENFNLTAQLLNSIKLFFQNERGVYAVMTALLAFPLLLLVAFAVDGTGLLLDKARLAQATDQAALLLIAEDNQYRKNKDHSDVSRQNVTQEEIEREREGRDFSTAKNQAQWKKRNQELVQGLVKLYLRSEDSQNNNPPITIKNPFDAECVQEITQPKNPNSSAKTVACTVQGSVERRFWLPWSQTLASNSQLDNGRLGINSGRTYAVKEKQISIPIDLMMVTDLSASMKWYIDKENTNAPKPHRRIDALREVVTKVEDILLPKENKESVSPYNRIGFVSFAAGARQRDDTSDCVLPYYANQSKRREISSLLKGNTNDIREGFKLLEEHMDVKKTITQIDQFKDGKRQTYDFALDSRHSKHYCLESSIGKKTTQGWFDKSSPNVARELSKIEPLGGTAVTSGMFIGVNLLTETNKDPDAAPSKLNTNTRRVLLVLSDGEDNIPSKNTLVRLMKDGLCGKIKEKVNSLQDPNYTKVETRIAFIALGFNPPSDQKAEWKQCVGEHYYPVFNKEALFDAFKQIISFEEEVGRSSSQKPKLFQ